MIQQIESPLLFRTVRHPPTWCGDGCPVPHGPSPPPGRGKLRRKGVQYLAANSRPPDPVITWN